jgi:hypothetical protein
MYVLGTPLFGSLRTIPEPLSAHEAEGVMRDRGFAYYTRRFTVMKEAEFSVVVRQLVLTTCHLHPEAEREDGR